MPVEEMGMFKIVLADGNNMSILLVNTSISKWVYCACGALAGIIVICLVIVFIKKSKSGHITEGDNTKEDNNGDTK
jgi:hypothetical protein